MSINHDHKLFQVEQDDDGVMHARIAINSITNDKAVDLAIASMDFATTQGASAVIVSATNLNAEGDEESAPVDAQGFGFQIPNPEDDEDFESDDDE